MNFYLSPRAGCKSKSLKRGDNRAAGQRTRPGINRLQKVEPRKTVLGLMEQDKRFLLASSPCWRLAILY